VPALGAAVVNGKGLTAVAVVGVRKRGTEVPATVTDSFHVGSNTKALTATMLASLVEEGKLDWDTTLEKAFPELARTMTKGLRAVTLTQLLSHHAGLPVDLPGGWGKVPLRGTPLGQRDTALRIGLKAKPAAEPGNKFLYSNLGYVMAAVMAERATRKPWEQLMRERVFKPLKMTGAGFGAMGKKGSTDQPWQHESDGTPVEPGPASDNPPSLGPAGRVHCSLPDYARFLADLLRGARGADALLKSATYKKLLTSPYPDRFYCLGGWAGQAKSPVARGGMVLAHDGSNSLNFASAVVIPARDFALAVVTNQGGERGEKACHEARDALARRFLAK
jgi:CubicO group peptidase (beta-lactamase class C family)